MKTSLASEQPSTRHFITNPHVAQCAFLASYLNLAGQASHWNSKLSNCYLTNLWIFGLKFSVLRQFGHVFSLFRHVSMHLEQINWLQSWHSCGSSTTIRQIVHEKYASRGLTALSVVNYLFTLTIDLSSFSRFFRSLSLGTNYCTFEGTYPPGVAWTIY